MSSSPASKKAKTTGDEEKADRRQLARSTKPIPCYAVDQIPPKRRHPDLYPSLAQAVLNQKANLVSRTVIPARDARSIHVQAGQLFRIVCSHGPQVADMNCWARNVPHYPAEHFYSSKTRQIHATHLTTGDRLWSNMPYLRPLATITKDTIAYGWDEDGAGVHDVIGSRCDPYTHKLMSGDGGGGNSSNNDNGGKQDESHVCCHSNLTRQCIRDGLKEENVHDVLNVFMCTGFTKDTHQYFTKPSPVQVGDYLEFLAETDLLVSASTCPQGDVSLACGGGGEPVVYPLTMQVYELTDADYLRNAGWEPSQISNYSRSHGIVEE